MAAQRLKYRQVTGTKTVYLGRRGTPIGETEPQPAPKVGNVKPDWKRKEYFTFFCVQDRANAFGRIQFQRNMRTGLSNLNYQKRGGNETFIIEEKDRQNMEAFLTYVENVKARAYAQAQAEPAHMRKSNTNSENSITHEFEEKYKAARKRYLSSLHRHKRERK